MLFNGNLAFLHFLSIFHVIQWEFCISSIFHVIQWNLRLRSFSGGGGRSDLTGQTSRDQASEPVDFGLEENQQPSSNTEEKKENGQEPTDATGRVRQQGGHRKRGGRTERRIAAKVETHKEKSLPRYCGPSSVVNADFCACHWCHYGACQRIITVLHFTLSLKSNEGRIYREVRCSFVQNERL